jgi:hypothetical protein
LGWKNGASIWWGLIKCAAGGDKPKSAENHRKVVADWNASGKQLAAVIQIRPLA